MTLDFTALDTWWWPWVFILVAGWLANDVWRWLGVAFAGRLTEDMEVFVWIRAVATALVAGVIAQLVFYPSGALAEVPVWIRAAAFAAGCLVFLALPGRQLFAGILVGQVVLGLGWLI